MQIYLCGTTLVPVTRHSITLYRACPAQPTLLRCAAQRGYKSVALLPRTGRQLSGNADADLLVLIKASNIELAMGGIVVSAELQIGKLTGGGVI